MTLASLNTKDVGDVLSSIRSEMNDPTFRDPLEGGGSDVLVLTNALDDGPAQKIDETIVNDGPHEENLGPSINGEINLGETSQATGDMGQTLSAQEHQEITMDDGIQPTERKDHADATEVIFDGTGQVSGEGGPSVDEIAFQDAQAQVGDIFVAESVASETTSPDNSQYQGEQSSGSGDSAITGETGKDFVSSSIDGPLGPGQETAQTTTTPQSFAGTSGRAQTSFGDPQESGEVLISPQTMAESTKAFSELTNMIQNMQNQTGQPTPVTGSFTTETAGNYTLESLMRELLRPMLKEWLDAHLPSLVKWLVAEQIEKMLLAQGIQVPADKKSDEAA